jgi:hypothetical protein
MKSVMHAGLVLVLVLGLAGIASAQVVPWKASDPPKADAPAAAAPAADAGAATGTPADAAADPKLEKAAIPVKEVLAQIAKAQKVLDDESAKPADKQDPKRVRSMTEAIARLYLNASQKAKAQSSSFKADEKQAFLDQYDKPNRDKGIGILLELANDSLAKKDYRNAESGAKQVLALDPKNAEAEALLKKIAEDKVAAAKTGSKTGSSGGSSLKDKNVIPGVTDFGRSGRDQKTDYGRSGRSW